MRSDTDGDCYVCSNSDSNANIYGDSNGDAEWDAMCRDGIKRGLRRRDAASVAIRVGSNQCGWNRTAVGNFSDNGGHAT